ncbi:MAG: hypothetical protein IT310_00555 [Anaerolineales bacterium]|nr:hypothetical protein [Anaerolineales bacterium]
MKKLFPFFILILLTAACNAPVTQNADGANALPTELVTESPAVTPLPTEVQTFLATTASAAPIDAPLVESPAIMRIDMLDALNGWGITETQIVRTNDGGVTWYNVTPPELTEVGYSVKEEFISPLRGWLLMADPNDPYNHGVLYQTADGGITWTSSAVPFGDGDLSFLDTNNGWMMAGLGVGAGSMAVAVFQTTDGGVTWERTFINDPNVEGADTSLPLSGLKGGLTPLNQKTAWIYGVVYASGSVYAFRTDDGGQTWSPVQLPLAEEAKSADLLVEKIQFTSATQGALILKVMSSKTSTVIYQTNDGGQTWQPASATLPETDRFEIISAQEMIAYGADQFYVTKDASATWSILPPDVVFGESLSAIDFASLSVGWAIAYDSTNNHYSLYKTEDGGATWFGIIP